MLELEKLSTSPFFKQITLKKGETLFGEGDTDENIYIVYDGELSIQKKTEGGSSETKSLALLGVGNILGEGAFHKVIPKEVSAIAARDSVLLSINAQQGFNELLRTEPEMGLNILKNIIHISNIRLLRSNKQVTANYEIHKAINNLTSLDNASVLGLIDIFAKIISCDGCLYLEKNPFVEKYAEYKYDSRFPGRLQDTPIEIQENDVSIESLSKDLELGTYSQIEELSIGDQIYGYLVITRNSKFFEEHEQKMLIGICNTFVGIIRQKKIQEEEKNKKYMRGV